MTEDSLVERALQLPVVERAAFLDRECAGQPDLRARVEALLAAETLSYSPNDRPVVESERTGAYTPLTEAYPPRSWATTDDSGKVEHADAVIAGKYTLIEPIGEGGMGSVWRANQTEPVKRFVAVKLIKAGMDSKAVLVRFEAERQALALMDHPNIAKVLDGGLHDHRPFFVMELVKGVPITQYCDANKLTPQARLELFVQACQAIQHAHQKGIIHRDIKPSNVLVALYDDRPVVKVIDFGVAKATGGTLTEATLDTGFGVVGTPQYMSPEQATFDNLDIDTRSDVYALGVLLYELLTGSPPFSSKELREKGLMEMLRVVREDEPPRPSTRLSTADALPSLSACRSTEPKKLTGLLRNELDWVVMKALEKDRTRRYETANGFAADVLRYLAGETVLAHPPSVGYRLRKFVKRNRGQVIAAGLILLVLVAGIVGTTLGLLEARHQTTIARSQEQEAKKQEGLAWAEAVAKEQARAAEAEQRRQAVEFRDLALDALRETTGTDVEKLIGGKKELGANEKAYLEAVAKRWQVFARRGGTDEQSRAMRAEGHFQVALLWQKLGRREEARPEYEQALAIREKLAADFPTVPMYRRELAASHNNLGLLLDDLGKRPEAEEQYRQALAIYEELATDFPTVPEHRQELAACQNNLGLLLKDLGKRQEAESQYRRALAIREKLVAEFPTVPEYRIELGGSYCNFGSLVSDSGKPAESLEWFDRAIRTLKPVHNYEQEHQPRVETPRHSLRDSHQSRAVAFDRLRKFAEADKDWDRAIELSPPSMQTHIRTLRAISRIQAGQVAEAVAEAADLAKRTDWNASQWYTFACVYAFAGGKLTDKKKEYADRAMELLHKAVKAGYKDADRMKKDTDLDILRERADFKKLLSALD